MNALRSAIRGTGEVLITLGVVVLLFCVHQLWWTTVQANAAADETTQELLGLWDDTPPPVVAPAPTTSSPSGPPIVVRPAEAFALVYVPRFGQDWVKPVLEGIGKSELSQGLGHYTETVLPGEVGNFSIAGHRTTYGQPFHNMDQLKQGDFVVVETDATWYVYRITLAQPDIVTPTQVDVIAAVPGQPGAAPTQKLLTMTTCHPKFSAKQRMIQHAELVSERPKSDGPPPELTAPLI